MADNADQLEQLTAYLDGELSPEERADVEALVNRDAEARQLLDELRETCNLVAALPRVRAPEGLEDAVTSRLEREALLGDAQAGTAMGATGGMWPRRLAIAASFALICTAGWFGWWRLSSPQAPVRLAEQSEPIHRERDVIALADKDDEAPVTMKSPNSRKSTAPLSGSPLEEEKMGSLGYVEATEELGDGESDAAPPPTIMPEKESGGTPLGRVPERRVQPPENGAYAVTAAGSAVHRRQEDRAASLDLLVATNAATNSMIQNAQANLFDNRLAVEVERPEVVARLAHIVESNMLMNHTPDLRNMRLEETIEADQAFVFKQSTEPIDARRTFGADFARAADATAPAASVVYYVNIPKNQLAVIVDSIQEYADSIETEAQWSANAVSIPSPAPAQAVIDTLLARADHAASTRTPVRPEAPLVRRRGRPGPPDAGRKAEGAKGATETEEGPDREGAAGALAGKPLEPTAAKKDQEDDPEAASPGEAIGQSAARAGHDEAAATDKKTRAAGARPARDEKDETADRGLRRIPVRGSDVAESSGQQGATLPASRAASDSQASMRDYITLALALRARAPQKALLDRATPDNQDRTPEPAHRAKTSAAGPSSRPTTQETSGG